MKSTGIVRNIDELGRIVIPKEMRNALGIETDDEVAFELKGNKIILTFDKVLTAEDRINKALELLEKEDIDLIEISSVLKGD